MSYMYWLPDEQGKKKYITESNAVIIVVRFNDSSFPIGR